MRKLPLVFVAVLACVTSLVAHGARAEQVSVSLTKSVASAPIFIAQELGYFAEENLEVELKYFRGGPPVAIAVASGDADIGITALSGAFFNMAGKGVLKLIAGGGHERPGHSSVVYLVSMQAYEAGIRQPKDVAGTTFGVTSIGSPGHYEVAKVAEKYDFPLSSLKIVPLGGFGNILSAIKGGRVDVSIFPSYVAEAAQARGEGKIIGRVGEETPYQFAAVFTTGKAVANRHDVLERFLRAYRKGSAAFAAAFQAPSADGGSATSSAARQNLVRILKNYTGMNEAQMLSGMSYIDPEGRLDVDDVRRQITDWVALGFVDSDISAEAIIAHSLVKPF